jgi:hypothetical protein
MQTEIKKIAPIIIILLALAATAIVSTQLKPKEIPVNPEFSGIADLSSQLGVSESIFTEYLTAIDSDYDSYVKYLNDNQLTPKDLAEKTKTETGYDFADYIQTITLMSNKTVPDAKIYDKIKPGSTLTSDTADIEIYVSKKSLENLKADGITLLPSTDNNDENATKHFQLFALLSYTGGDIPTFISGANSVFGCDSVELTNINVYAGYGVKKPANENKMVDDLFNVKTGTNEIYKAVAMPVLTLKYSENTDPENENEPVSFGVIDSAGLIFTAKDVDTLAKLEDTECFDMQIRQVPKKPETAETIGESENITTSTNANIPAN